MFCMSCGASLDPKDAFCMACGALVAPAPPAPSLPPAPMSAAPPAAPFGPPAGVPPPGYGPMGGPVPRPGLSQGAKAAVAIVLVLAVVGVGVAAFLLVGGGATGTCVGVSWNGSYYDYTRVYGYTEAECDAWCSSHSFGSSCYWEP